MTQKAATVPNWTLGDRLRKAREHAGFEQGELAARIGISRNTVGNYELDRGQRGPKMLVLRAWAHECDVPLDWLLQDSPFAGAHGAGSSQGGIPDSRGYLHGPAAA